MSNDLALLDIVFLSIKVAFFSMVMVVPLAIWVGWLLAKPNLRFKFLLSALVHLPLVLPPVVTGYVLLLAFGKNGVIGAVLDSIGITLTFSWVGASLAAAVMAFPLVVRPVRLAFESQDERIWEMAATLGASPWKRFKTVALPLAVPGILAGLVMGFAKALGEFGATITFVSNIPGETQTLSLAIYTLLQSPTGESLAITLVVISVGISFAAILMSEWVMLRLEKRRAG